MYYILKSMASLYITLANIPAGRLARTPDPPKQVCFSWSKPLPQISYLHTLHTVIWHTRKHTNTQIDHVHMKLHEYIYIYRKNKYMYVCILRYLNMYIVYIFSGLDTVLGIKTSNYNRKKQISCKYRNSVYIQKYEHAQTLGIVA